MSKQYEMAFQIGAKVQGSFGSAFKSAASSVQGLQKEIESLNKRQSDINSYQKTQQAIDKTAAKLSLYQQQYANLKAEMERNGQASAAEQNALLAKAKAIDDLKAKQEQLEGKLASTGAALENEGVDLNNLGSASAQTAQQIDQLRGQQEALATASDEASSGLHNSIDALSSFAIASGISDALGNVANAFKDCAEEAIAFENYMASVKRTVGGNDQFIGELSEDFKALSTQIPITTEDLAAIATTAGQLGIAQDQVELFATVMAKLATTTDLSADSAATMIAQFANITGVTDFERLGSVVADLGDSTATTASKIVEMSQGMAASANLAGMSATDIMAISAAVGSLGIEAQAGSTAMSTLINTLYKATETGENLADFAAVAGMTADQFKQAWATDAAGAMSQFIAGLNDVERNGRSAIVILDELGISNVRQTKAILGLASAGDLLSNTIEQSSAAWQQNTALEEKASVMYETTQAKLTMMGNAFSNMKVAIGDAFLPVISEVSDALTGMMGPVTQFLQENPALVKAIGTAAAVIGGVTAALAAYTVAAKIAAAASSAFSASLGPIMAVTAGVALLAGAFVAFSSSSEEVQQSLEEIDAEFDAVNDRIARDNDIIDMCNNYEKLSKQIDHTVDTTKKMENFDDISITLGATAEQELTAKNFLVGEDTEVKLTAEKDPNGTPIENFSFLVNGDTEVNLTAAPAENANTLTPDVFFVDEDTQAELTAQKDPNAALIDAGAFIEAGSDTIKLKPGTDGTKINPEQEMMETTGVKLSAQPDGVKLSVNAFVNGDRNIKFTASWTNKEDMEKDVAALKKAATDAKEELATAQENMRDIALYKEQLESRQEHATGDAKTALEEDLARVNDALDEQKTLVNDLEEKYELAAGQYIITAQASETLTAHSEELLSIQEALGIKTDGVTGALIDETGAIRDQIQAAKDKAEADKELAKTAAYDTMLKESEAFAKHWARVQESASTITTYRADLIRLQGEMDNYSTSTSAQLENALNDVNKIYDKYVTFAGDYFMWDELNQSEKNRFFKLQQMMKELTGQSWAADDFVRYDVQEKVREQIVSLEDLEKEYVMTSNAIDSLTSNQKDSQQSIETYITTLSDAVAVGAMTREQLKTRLERQFADVEGSAEMVKYVMDGVEASLAGAAEAAEDLGENISGALSPEQVSEKIQPIIDQMTALEEAYNAAYDSAYKSLDGQFKLFEQLDEITTSEDPAQAVEDYIEALRSQQQYLADYQANWDQLKKDGLNETLLTQLSDGSEESARILADLVAAGAGRINELNIEFEKVEEGKKSFAGEIAEMETDFSTTMEQLQADLESTIEKMDMSAEAASSARSTMDAFADAAEGKLDKVKAAFQKVANAAKQALKVEIDGDGYASGTESATPGFHMVGENGPEMVFMNGGEKVLDAQQTKNAMEAMSIEPVNAISAASVAGGGYTIEIQKIEYVISGSANEDELRALLDDTTNNLRDKIEEALDDIVNDRQRRAYV